MRNVIIPYPTYSSEFKNTCRFLSEIDIRPLEFILSFIFDHGNQHWNYNYGDVESWIYTQLDRHHTLYTAFYESGALNDPNNRQYLLPWQKMNDQVNGDDPMLEDYIHDATTLLFHYYRFISLPCKTAISSEDIVWSEMIGTDALMVRFTNTIGEEIHDHYTLPQVS